MRQRTISDYFWRDPAICDLSQEDKATLLYFLTSPSSNIIGVYQVVWGIAAAEMGWTKDQMVTVAKRLKHKGLIDFNEAGWVLVKIWWNHNSARGAFSPKLLENAKKQCSMMPSDWLDEYLKQLEVAGIDRVSIGYPYPIDTPVPNTTCNSSCNTTTTTGQGDEAEHVELVFPKQLNEHEYNSVHALIKKIANFPLEKKQEILDELAGAMLAKSINSGCISFFRGLVDAAINNSFVPNRGIKVLESRISSKKRKNEGLQNNENSCIDPCRLEKIKHIKNLTLSEGECHA